LGALAGQGKGPNLETYLIITTDPNELISGMALHDRMPVILKLSRLRVMAGAGCVQKMLLYLLQPYNADAMTAWPVGAGVSNVRNNEPELCEPISPPQIDART
jgi:putative SOS response-associated peptidase YedK